MRDGTVPCDYDFIVIGSGFGGSVSALRLAEKGYRVAVIEMGRRWTPETLPRTNWSLARWIWRPALGLRGFFSLRLFRHAMVLHGNAVGGGSITYGGTLLVPPDSVWAEGTWVGLADWKRVLPAHFDTAKRPRAWGRASFRPRSAWSSARPAIRRARAIPIPFSTAKGRRAAPASPAAAA